MTGVGGMKGAHCHSGCRFAVSKVYPNSRSEGEDILRPLAFTLCHSESSD
jgi:hypothetical protein